MRVEAIEQAANRETIQLNLRAKISQLDRDREQAVTRALTLQSLIQPILDDALANLSQLALISPSASDSTVLALLQTLDVPLCSDRAKQLALEQSILTQVVKLYAQSDQQHQAASGLSLIKRDPQLLNRLAEHLPIERLLESKELFRPILIPRLGFWQLQLKGVKGRWECAIACGAEGASKQLGAFWVDSVFSFLQTAGLATFRKPGSLVVRRLQFADERIVAGKESLVLPSNLEKNLLPLLQDLQNNIETAIRALLLISEEADADLRSSGQFRQRALETHSFVLSDLNKFRAAAAEQLFQARQQIIQQAHASLSQIAALLGVDADYRIKSPSIDNRLLFLRLLVGRKDLQPLVQTVLEGGKEEQLYKLLEALTVMVNSGRLGGWGLQNVSECLQLLVDGCRQQGLRQQAMKLYLRVRLSA